MVLCQCLFLFLFVSFPSLSPPLPSPSKEPKYQVTRNVNYENAPSCNVTIFSGMVLTVVAVAHKVVEIRVLGEVLRLDGVDVAKTFA